MRGHESQAWLHLPEVFQHVISDKVVKKTERRRTVKQEETWTEKELELPVDWNDPTILAMFCTNYINFATGGVLKVVAP